MKQGGIERGSQKNRIVFAGGGTGGHIYPIIAVYEKLKSHNSEFVYFVSQGNPEEKIATKNNLRTQVLPRIGGMPKSIKLIWWIFKLLRATFIAYFKLLKEKPNIIFATGGYGTAPVLLAAKFLKIPYIIHNLDAFMGLANSLFIDDCRALTLGMPLVKSPSLKQIHPKNGSIIITGNPVRQEFYEKSISKSPFQGLELEFDTQRKTLIIMGGSQGARIINEIVIQSINTLTENNWQIIHQLGEKEFNIWESSLPKSKFYKPFKYLDKVHEILEIADVAICRSGAMSIAELNAKKVPSLLIPLPTSAQNHQLHNAKISESQGTAIILEQCNLNSQTLIENIEIIYERRNLMKLNFENILDTNTNSAADLISEIIVKAIS